MRIVDQHLLLKTTDSGAQQWRQFNLYVNTMGTSWVIKVFKGRSKVGLEFKQQLDYGWKEEAELDLKNLIGNAENSGFVYKDRVLEKIIDTPFSQFTALTHSIVGIEEAEQRGKLHDDSYRLIPVFGGVHCCIKIGYDTAFHVEAKTTNNEIIPLPDIVKKNLIDMVTLCEFETFVLEAFVTKSDITIIDVLCVNGLLSTKPLLERMALLSGLIGNDNILTQCKKPSKIDLNCSFSQTKKPYWYAIKALDNKLDDNIESTTQLIPQYYIFNVMASRVRDDLLAHRDKMQRLKLLMSKTNSQGEHELIDVGEIKLPIKYPSHNIRLIESVGFVNGKLIAPRVCRRQYNNRNLARSCSSQVENLPSHWAANL